jgi:hypothetical protein
MFIRHVARTVGISVAAAAVAGTFSIIALAGPAGAAGPNSGDTVPTAATPVTPFTPGTPFSSGQNINVVVPANTIFSPNTNINIVECAAPGGVVPTDPGNCDGNTINGPTLKPNADGSINFQTKTGTLYQLFALPDANLGETGGGVTCDLSHQCVLYIGNNQGDFTQPHVWSQPFYITPNPTDSGANPGDGTPEVPMAVILPLAALGLVGGSVLIHRRRSAKSAA